MVLYHLVIIAQSTPKYTVPQVKVSPPVNAESYVRKLGKDTARVFFDKDLITVVYRGQENSFRVPDWLGSKAASVPGTDAFIAQIRYANAQQVFFSDTLKVGETYIQRPWRGPKSMALPTETKQLKGQILQRTIASKELGEDRKYTVYIPPNPPSHLPAVYITDQQCEWFAKALEPLILAKKIAPVALVGVAAGGYRGPTDNYDFMQDFRAREYLKRVDPDRFVQHMKFFCDEIVPACEKEFGFIADPKSRVVSGYSNGGAFALSAVIDRSDTFASAIVLSPGATFFDELATTSKGKKSNIWLAAGRLEVFLGNARQAYDVLKKNDVPTHLDEYESGHEGLMWRMAFLRRLQVCLTGKKPG